MASHISCVQYNAYGFSLGHGNDAAHSTLHGITHLSGSLSGYLRANFLSTQGEHIHVILNLK